MLKDGTLNGDASDVVGEARMRMLEKLEDEMEFYPTSFDVAWMDIEDAVRILDFDVDHEVLLLENTDPKAYSDGVVKEASKKFKEISRLIHPDKSPNEFDERSTEAFKFLSNVFDVVKTAYTDFLIRSVEDICLAYEISKDMRLQVRVTWKASDDLDTVICVHCGDVALVEERQLPPEADSYLFYYDEDPQLFQSGTVALYHLATAGPLKDVVSRKMEVDLSVPNEVWISLLYLRVAKLHEEKADDARIEAAKAADAERARKTLEEQKKRDAREERTRKLQQKREERKRMTWDEQDRNEERKRKSSQTSACTKRWKGVDNTTWSSAQTNDWDSEWHTNKSYWHKKRSTCHARSEQPSAGSQTNSRSTKWHDMIWYTAETYGNYKCNAEKYHYYNYKKRRNCYGEVGDMKRNRRTSPTLRPYWEKL